MVSYKQHNENVYIQNAKGTFQKLLFQTKIFFEKHVGGRVGLGRERTQETDLTVLIKGKFGKAFQLNKEVKS